jgi:hypothetical protein
MGNDSPVYFPAIQELEFPLLQSPQNNGNISCRGVFELEHQCGVYAPSEMFPCSFKIILQVWEDQDVGRWTILKWILER